MDDCRAQQIEGLTDDFDSLEVLSLINVGLTTLKGFPKLVNLKKVFIWHIFLIKKISKINLK